MQSVMIAAVAAVFGFGLQRDVLDFELFIENLHGTLPDGVGIASATIGSDCTGSGLQTGAGGVLLQAADLCALVTRTGFTIVAIYALPQASISCAKRAQRGRERDHTGENTVTARVRMFTF